MAMAVGKIGLVLSSSRVLGRVLTEQRRHLLLNDSQVARGDPKVT